eukprot:1159059-Pelagomonas_calceolata.AAC.3
MKTPLGTDVARVPVNSTRPARKTLGNMIHITTENVMPDDGCDQAASEQHHSRRTCKHVHTCVNKHACLL